MLRSGVDIYIMARLMNHSGTRSLERYLKLEDSDMRQAHQRFSLS